MFHKIVLFIVSVMLSISVDAQCPTGGPQEGGQGGGGESGSGGGSGNDWEIPIVRPSDPNDIQGPLGYQAGQWVSVNDQLQYVVRFENDPKVATAPAQNVYVRIPLHSRINGNTLKLSSFGFGKYNFTIPPNSITYSTRLDLSDSLGLYLDVTAGIDVTRNEVFWTFKSIDPATGLAPQNALSGFLPVNDTGKNPLTDTIPGKGEGYVSFVLSPRKTLLTGDTVSEQANIVFDINEPIVTNVWTNIIDAFPPVSHVKSYTTANDTIKLRWSGQDDPGGTGVKDYALYVSENNAPFALYKKGIPDTTFSYVGVIGNQYRFFTIAADNVGNKEALKTAGERTVVLTNSGAPVFTGGTPQSFMLCQDAAAKSLDSLLAISDTSSAQTITWSVLNAPVHGTLSGFPATGTSGANVITAALSYQPTASYSGLDSFDIQASDGFETSAVTILVTVAPSISNNSISANQVVCIGRAPVLLSGTIPASGGGIYSYVWQQSNTGLPSDFNAVLSAGTGRGYQPGGTSIPLWYRRLVVSVAGCTSVSNIISIDTTTINRWTGIADSAWSNVANWSCAVPTSTTDGIIPAGYPHAPVVDIPNAAVRHLSLDSGAELRFASAASRLDIYGLVTAKGTFDALPGTVGFRSSAQQNIPAGYYSQIIIDGAGLKTLDDSVSIQNQLTLSTGNIRLGGKHLIVQPSGSIIGGATSSHIITDGSGRLIQQGIGGTGRIGAIYFPIGSGATSYTPASISNSGTLDDFSAGVIDSLYNSYSGEVPTGRSIKTDGVNKTWLLSERTLGGSAAVITLEWNGIDELAKFKRGASIVRHYTGGVWDSVGTGSGAVSGTDPYTLSSASMGSFSPFSVLSVDPAAIDTSKPVISGCPSNITMATGPASTICGRTVTWTAPTATDNSGSVIVSSSHQPGGTFPRGITTVTYTFTDSSNNSSICSFTVTVIDSTAPVISGCPSNISLANCNQIVTWTAPTAVDNCGGSVAMTMTRQPGTRFPVGVTTVAYTFTDSSNNRSTCSFTVTVSDSAPPVVSGCPSNISVKAGSGSSNCSQIATWIAPTAVDSCSGLKTVTSTHLPGALFAKGVTTVTYTFTDSSNNSSTCSFTVTVSDSAPPVISSCPSNIIVYTGPGSTTCNQTATWIAPTAVDSCSGVKTVSSSHLPGATFLVGTTTVSYAFTDSSNNGSTCSFTVTVLDDTPPVISDCPADLVVADSNQLVKWTPPTASDNCGGNVSMTSTHQPGTTFPVGVTTVTYTFTDSSSNVSTCSFTVTVGDPSVTVKNASGRPQGQIKVYPNPNSGLFIVELPAAMKDYAEITVTDIRGRLIARKLVEPQNGNKISFQLGDVVPGMYTVQVVYGGQRFHTKLKIE